MSEIKGTFDSNTVGIKLILPSNIGMDYFKRKLLRNSTAFQILEMMFFEKTLTIDEILNKQLISRSTLYRIIKKLNEEITKFGFDVTVDKQIKLVGPEILIRRFYERYFIEAYSTQEWPFPMSRHELTQKTSCKFKKEFGGEAMVSPEEKF